MASQKRKSVCNQRWFFISLVLVIAIGGMTLFVCTAVMSSSQKDVSLYKRAALYIKENVRSTFQSSIKSIKNTFHRRQRSVKVNKFPYKNIRLPKDILPSTYKLYLRPDLSSTFDFNGRVAIDITCVKPTRYVILHHKKLDIKDDYKLLDSSNNEVKVLRMLQNEKNEQFLLETEKDLEPGKKYTVKLTFTGNLSNKMAGFYKSSYKTKKGETRLVKIVQHDPWKLPSFPVGLGVMFSQVRPLLITQTLDRMRVANARHEFGYNSNKKSYSQGNDRSEKIHLTVI